MTEFLLLALMLVALAIGPRTAVLVIGYLLAMLTVTAPYMRWRKRRAAGRRASPDG